MDGGGIRAGLVDGVSAPVGMSPSEALAAILGGHYKPERIQKGTGPNQVLSGSWSYLWEIPTIGNGQDAVD